MRSRSLLVPTIAIIIALIGFYYGADITINGESVTGLEKLYYLPAIIAIISAIFVLATSTLTIVAIMLGVTALLVPFAIVSTLLTSTYGIVLLTAVLAGLFAIRFWLSQKKEV